jgi:hypothetical protein
MMRRKETSGAGRPHIKVRFFGGGDFESGLVDRKHRANAGCSQERRW